MRSVAVVAWREIIEHRMFLLAAVAIFLVSLVVPPLVKLGGWSSSEIRDVFTWVMAIGFTWVSAGLLGAATVSSAVTAGRFGFFMARPVTSSAVWFGKILGVMVVLVVCELIVVLPVALSTDPLDVIGRFTELPLVWVGVIAGIPLLLALVGHAVATIWRAGSAWVAVDLVALAIVASAAWLSVSPLERAGAEDAAIVVGLLPVAGLMMAVLGAGAVQIAVGRCDRKRQHRAFALVLWPSLLLAVAGAAGYSAWLRSPEAGDLAGAGWVAVQPAGRWIGLSGPARNRLDVDASFVVDLEGGRSQLLGLGPRWDPASVASFSADGSTAAWVDRDGEQWRVRFVILDELASGVRASPILQSERVSLRLSPTGQRMATVKNSTLVATEVASGDFLGAARLPADHSVFAYYFDGEGEVRVLMVSPRDSEIGRFTVRALEFDLADRRLRETGALADVGEMVTATLDQARDRLLVRTRINRDGIWRYVDARTLEVVEWSAGQEFAPVTEMLADGRLVRLANEGEASWLERLTADGEIDGRAELPSKPGYAVIGFQPTPSTVTVAVRGRNLENASAEAWKLLLVDLDTGGVREIGQDLVPPRWAYSGGEVVTPLPAGCVAARLLHGNRSSLWLWDQQLDEMRLLFQDDH